MTIMTVGGRVVYLCTGEYLHRTVNRVLPASVTLCGIGCTCTLQQLTFVVTYYRQLVHLKTAVCQTFRGEVQVQVCNTWLWLGVEACMPITDRALGWWGTQSIQSWHRTVKVDRASTNMGTVCTVHDHLPLSNWVFSKLEWTAPFPQHHRMTHSIPG